jgi:hypothetical protein
MFRPQSMVLCCNWMRCARRWSTARGVCSTMSMKQACFIMPHQTVTGAARTQHCMVQRQQRIASMCYTAQMCQEQINGSCLLLGYLLCLNVFRGFQWTVLPVVYYANTYCYDNIYIWKVQELSITTQIWQLFNVIIHMFQPYKAIKQISEFTKILRKLCIT